MEEEQIHDNYGVYIDESLTKRQVQDWQRRRRERSIFPKARILGPRPRMITPEGGNVESIKTRGILKFHSADRARLFNNEMSFTHKVPEIASDIPISQIISVEDEDFTMANAKDVEEDTVMEEEEGEEEIEEEVEEDEVEEEIEEQGEEEQGEEEDEEEEDEEIDVPIRQGLIEEIQQGSATARRINVQATFQPKAVILQPPTVPQPKARIIPGIVSPVTSPQRTVELSKPGQRLSSTSESILGFIDPSKLTTKRGSYTVDELKLFLEKLDLTKSGNKEDLILRLKKAIGYN